jgi:hypothetical protein
VRDRLSMAQALCALLLALTAAAPRPARADDHFTPIHRVLTGPRCMNCHTSVDHPRQGDEGRRHDMGVVRGPANHGAAAMRCSTCHTDRNQAVVPGAPHWGLAPLSMSWDDKDAAALCRQLADPRRNGHRTPAQLLDHMANDPLVAWGWAPGGKRTPVPMEKAAFIEAVKAWIGAGMPCGK